METDITETLHDESLVLPAEGKTNHLHVFWSIQENVGTVEDTATSGRDAAVDTTCDNLQTENITTRLPCEMGLPVTQAGAFKSIGLSLAYSLAIQAISRSPKYQLCNCRRRYPYVTFDPDWKTSDQISVVRLRFPQETLVTNKLSVIEMALTVGFTTQGDNMVRS